MITRMLVWRSAVVLLCISILLGHLLAPVYYVWTIRTISDLGSQGYPLAWLMRAGFLAFGGLLLLSLWAPGQPTKLGLVPVFVVGYGIAIGASGIWSAAPFVDGAVPDEFQNQGHIIAANVAGFLLILGMIASAITAKSVKHRLVDIIGIVLVTSFSLVFKLSQSGVTEIPIGVVQRLIFLSGLGWIWLRAGRTS